MRSDVDRYSRGGSGEERASGEERPEETRRDPEASVQFGEDPGNLAADGADGADAGRTDAGRT